MRELSKENLEAIHYLSELQPERLLGKFETEYLIDDFLEMPAYELESNHMRINDVVWGDCEIGDKPYDPMLIELARTPLFRRLQAIEQLTLGDEYATMPNSTRFSRWQHVWGSVAFVRKMVEGESIDPREAMVLQLRTLLSDVGHTAFSHLGDWLFQGVGDKEDLHDQDLKDLLVVTGIDKILEKYNFTVDEAVFPDVEDWVEAPSPDLCVDRVDYAMREILRWQSAFIPLNMYKSQLHNPKNVFDITPDNKLAFKDKKVAELFTAGFSILPTEHWGHPVHRLQLELLMSATRYALANESARYGLHPRDAMYAIDNDLSYHFLTWENVHTHDLMRNTAREQRKIFSTARKNDLEAVFTGIKDKEWKFPKFPEPLDSKGWRSDFFVKPIPPQIDVVKHHKIPNKDTWWVSERGLHMWLSPLKARGVDPLVAVKNGYRRLSTLNHSLEQFLSGQKVTMAQGYEAIMFMRPEVAEKMVEHHEVVKEAWPELLTIPRDNSKLRRKIEDTMSSAAGRRFDRISDW